MLRTFSTLALAFALLASLGCWHNGRCCNLRPSPPPCCPPAGAATLPPGGAAPAFPAPPGG